MDIIFTLVFIPIFILLLIPLFFMRGTVLILLWFIFDALIAHQVASSISSFAHEQWLIASTSFAVYPFFEALKVAIIAGLCLVGVAILIFSFYFIPLYLVFRGLREPEPYRPIVPAHSFPRPTTQISQTSRKMIRRLIESQQGVDDHE